MASIILSFFLGLAVVLQGMMNRQISNSWGLAATIAFNNIILFAVGLFIYFITKYYPQYFPEFFRVKEFGQGFSWYYVLPGLLGLVIVAGVPLAISKIGAMNVFVGMVCAQVIVSLILDYYIEQIPMTWNRILGAAFTVLGVMLFKVKF